jgi:hypothetical protein
VLVTTRGLVSTRWYFRRGTGELIGFDTALDEDVDPCEVRLFDLAPQGEVKFPRRLIVRHGDKTFGEFTIDSLQLLKTPGGPQP